MLLLGTEFCMKYKEFAQNKCAQISLAPCGIFYVYPLGENAQL